MLRRDLFSNNARGVLADAVSSSDTIIYLPDEGTAQKFVNGFSASVATETDRREASGAFQYVTLVNPNDPQDFEIIRTFKMEQDSSRNDQYYLSVERAQEGTVSKAWGVGTLLEARLTADVLDRFVQQATDGLDIGDSQGGLGVLKGAWSRPGLLTLRGWPVVTLNRDRPFNPTITSSADIAPARVCAGKTACFALGTVSEWQSNQVYAAGDIVKSTSAAGKQWVFEPDQPDHTTSTIGAPGFSYSSGTGYAQAGFTAPYDGWWFASTYPLNHSFSMPFPVLLTEVGFVCTKFSDVSVLPTVSIGVTGNSTAIADAIELTRAGGVRHVHRFVLGEDNGLLADGLTFNVTTSADGVCDGFFYWMGVPFEFGS